MEITHTSPQICGSACIRRRRVGSCDTHTHTHIQGSYSGEKMKGIAEINGAEHRAVMRWGMKRVVFVSIAMVCSMLAVALSSDTFTLFSVNTTHNLLHISLSPSPLLSSPSSHSAPTTPPSQMASSPSSSPVPSAELSPLALASKPLQLSSSAQSASSKPGCDYTIGMWVKDENRTLYSGRGCKRWLSGMWACRLMPSRPNFNYENYRWQPHGCNLPVFDSQKFLARMRNKVVAFVGDSIGRQQYQSFMCMLTGGNDEALVEDVSKMYGLVKPRGAVRADGTAQRFTETNTTIIYYWSASLCEIRPLNKSDPNTKYAMHLDRPATFIQKYLAMMDVLVLNTGHHWNRGKLEANKWVMHVDGKPNTDRKLERNVPSARTVTIQKVAAWLHKQREKNATQAEIYIRSLSPRHFFNGEWDSGGRCDDDFIPAKQVNATGPASDPVVESAILGTSLNLLNVTYISQFRYDAHISKYRPNQSGQDCLHWCLPGVPDVWNELLYASIFARDDV